jgi:hypothetical protein
LLGDTAYAAPNVYLKFWLDSLPEAATNYSFAWNLGDGTTSVSASPEHLYEVGTYNVQVDITHLNNGQIIERNLVLVVTNDVSFETTIILLESTPVAGSNYDYKLAFKSTAIYNYENTTGSRWVNGDFTGWNQQATNEVTMINNIEYIIYHLVLPANETEKQRWGYGRGSNWAFAPSSRYWLVNDQGEGAFEAYFTDGQMSIVPVTYTNLPGDGGDINEGSTLATIRTEIIEGDEDELRIYINYGVYANGSNPFLSQLVSNNNWDPVALTSIGDGWGYKDFVIADLGGSLYWRFGANINHPTIFGNMTNSKFFMSSDNMLGMQVTQLKSGKWQVIQIE